MEREQIERRARELTLPDGVELRFIDGGLALCADGMSLCEDFRELLPRLRHDRLGREMLVRAARVRGVEAPHAVDATAGLGEDSLLLAAAGIVSRMRLVEADSVEVLAGLDDAPDVVYLDPMFPGRTKSAAVKKKFQLLHHLEAPCADEDALMGAALAAGPRRVVVKRPVKAPVLAGVRPTHSVAGKAVRFDVIVRR